MDPTMTASLKEVLRNTLDHLAEDVFKRFKHRLRDQGQIPWRKSAERKSKRERESVSRNRYDEYM